MTAVLTVVHRGGRLWGARPAPEVLPRRSSSTTKDSFIAVRPSAALEDSAGLSGAAWSPARASAAPPMVRTFLQC